MPQSSIRMSDLDTIRIEEMTWPMVKKALGEGYRTVIVPVGSIEQHGPHLPTGTDAFAGDAFGLRVAEKLGKALVAPTIRPGCSEHHMDFPGTITISPETLIRVLIDVCDSLDRHGFENIILIPTHGGNFAPVATATQIIAPKLKANLIALTDLGGLISKMNEAMAEFGVSAEASGAHSGAAETSLMMAYKPELVREGEETVGYMGPLTSKYVRAGFKAVTPTGVFGDATKASRQAGDRIIELVTEMYVENIKRELES